MFLSVCPRTESWPLIGSQTAACPAVIGRALGSVSAAVSVGTGTPENWRLKRNEPVPSICSRSINFLLNEICKGLNYLKVKFVERESSERGAEWEWARSF